jgi:penicillin-binding protein 1C
VGEVSVRAALQLSLNVPAVAVLDRLGTARFMQALAGAGAVAEFDRRATEAPGLPVILGGLGISLADMAMLYAALADDGRARPLVLRHGAAREAGEGRPFVEPRAAQWTREILRGVPPPEPWSQRGGARPIAWKTGTSYGFRDALAFGSTRRFTVAVWVGRADGTPRPGQYGRSAAAPILFKAFDLLPPEAWPDPPRRLGAPPPALARLAPRGAEDRPWADGERGLAILFPPDGATIELARMGGELVPLALKAQGGRGRLTWIVDGRPLAAAPRLEPRSYVPEGEGFLRLVVVDEAGASAQASVRIVEPR